MWQQHGKAVEAYLESPLLDRHVWEKNPKKPPIWKLDTICNSLLSQSPLRRLQCIRSHGDHKSSQRIFTRKTRVAESELRHMIIKTFILTQICTTILNLHANIAWRLVTYVTLSANRESYGCWKCIEVRLMNEFLKTLELSKCSEKLKVWLNWPWTFFQPVTIFRIWIFDCSISINYVEILLKGKDWMKLPTQAQAQWQNLPFCEIVKQLNGKNLL